MAEQLNLWKSLGLIGLIVGLLVVGLWTTVRSGAVSMNGSGSVPTRLVAANLSKTAVMVSVWLVVLLAIQILVGYRIAWPSW